jgi:hypothetical protein
VALGAKSGTRLKVGGDMYFFSGEGLKEVGGFKVFVLWESCGFLKCTGEACVFPKDEGRVLRFLEAHK